VPSLKEIAKHANTSVTTVSLVLNGRDGPNRISAATRDQVLEAARALGYTPNIAARRLRAGGGAAPPTIGLLLPFDERLTITVRAVGTIRETLDAWAGERGVAPPDLLIETYPGGHLAGVRSLADNTRYNGAFLFSTLPEDDAYLARVGPLAVPVVLVQRSVAGHAWVNVDNRRVGARVADHLLGLGHRRFGVVAATVAGAALDDRREGFLTRLREAGGIELPPDRIERGAFSEIGGRDAAARLVERLRATGQPLPTALYVTADLMALGALHALKRAGLRIPADVAVVGTDNDPYAPFIDPPLTTVDIARTRSAELASRRLLHLVTDRDAAVGTDLLDSRLVVRASCGAAGHDRAPDDAGA
jgi:LacI family transcriptional regulator